MFPWPVACTAHTAKERHSDGWTDVTPRFPCGMGNQSRDHWRRSRHAQRRYAPESQKCGGSNTPDARWQAGFFRHVGASRRSGKSSASHTATALGGRYAEEASGSGCQRPEFSGLLPSAKCCTNDKPFRLQNCSDASVIVHITEFTTPGYRQIFIDGRPHPKDWNPSWMGHSTGKWDGDTLVVDTVGFNEITPGFGIHTEKLHVVERFQRRIKRTSRWILPRKTGCLHSFFHAEGPRRIGPGRRGP